MISRRNFNKLSFGSFGLFICPKILYAQNYSGPINWVGGSFLTIASDIEKDFPITKPASEILVNENNSTFLNTHLINKLKSDPISNIDLNLGGYADGAELALTFGFSAEFDFGTFDDETDNTSIYLIYSFGQSLLYNPKSRIIVSSVPVRHIAPHVVKKDEIKNFKNIKVELMKRAFHNQETPNQTYIQQFRNMLQKQSFTKKEWLGRKPKVTDIILPEDENLYKNFGLSKRKFKEFLGQSATFAFGYKLNSPIIPYTKTKGLGLTTIMRFNAATKLYQKVATKLPNPDLEIHLIHQGWEFVEEPLQENAKNVLNVQLGMGVQLKVIDTFEEEEIYNQSFFASKQYIENNDNVMRSDAATVCELTEALLERIFQSVVDDNYRIKLLKGDQVESSLYSAYFQLDNENTDEVVYQSKKFVNSLPKA